MGQSQQFYVKGRWIGIDEMKKKRNKKVVIEAIDTKVDEEIVKKKKGRPKKNN